MSEIMEQKGRIVLDLKPGAGNPRNSEGAFLDLKNGRLLFAYSRYLEESGADDGKACIAARYSSDDGCCLFRLKLRKIKLSDLT